MTALLVSGYSPCTDKDNTLTMSRLVGLDQYRPSREIPLPHHTPAFGRTPTSSLAARRVRR